MTFHIGNHKSRQYRTHVSDPHAEGIAQLLNAAGAQVVTLLEGQACTSEDCAILSKEGLASAGIMFVHQGLPLAPWADGADMKVVLDAGKLLEGSPQLAHDVKMFVIENRERAKPRTGW